MNETALETLMHYYVAEQPFYKNEIRVDTGDVYWLNDAGNLHRDNGPAVERVNGMKLWLQNGLLHRDAAPAVLWGNGTSMWFCKEHLHREDGPAVILADGSVEYWLEGTQLTEQTFTEYLNERNTTRSVDV